MTRLAKPLLVALWAGLALAGAGCNFWFTYQPSPDSGSCAVRAPLLLGSTLLGVHNLANANVAANLGAQAVRLILSDDAIRAGFATEDAGGVPSFATALARFQADGVPVIITIRWPEVPGVKGTPDFDRVPTGTDRSDSLALLDRFLQETAGKVAWYQLQNEPLGGPGAYHIADRPASLDWLTVLAEEACSDRAGNPALASLRLTSPGLTGLDAQNPDPDTVASATAMLDVVRAQRDMPLVSMEWSQSKAAKAWLGQHVSDARFGSGTNRDFVTAAYQQPVSANLWRAFVATAPFDLDLRRPHLLS